jgi:hypothetical protein
MDTVTGQDFGSMTPQDLASELVRVIRDADSNTAHTALEIAKLLIAHRDHAQLNCDREMLSGQSSGLPD